MYMHTYTRASDRCVKHCTQSLGAWASPYTAGYRFFTQGNNNNVNLFKVYYGNTMETFVIFYIVIILIIPECYCMILDLTYYTRVHT